MTDTPQRPDALSPQYDPGSASPDTMSPVPAATPDPSADRFSAFDEPATSRESVPPVPPVPTVLPTSPVSPTPVSPTPGSTGSPFAPSPSSASSPASRARRVVVGVLAVIGVVTVLLVGLVVMVARGSSDAGSSSSSGSRDDGATLPLTPVSVAPSAVPSVPQRPTQVRVEFHGTGRVVDLRLYSSGGRTTRLTGVTLPYAADLAVDPDDAYFSFSADDYGYRGTEAMSCSVTTGGVELSRAVGTQTVDCKVTDGSWRNTRG